MRFVKTSEKLRLFPFYNNQTRVVIEKMLSIAVRA